MNYDHDHPFDCPYKDPILCEMMNIFGKLCREVVQERKMKEEKEESNENNSE